MVADFSGPDGQGRERACLIGLLQRYGHNATSFQVLGPAFRYWFTDDAEACVAFVDTGRAWVVAGAPIAPVERLHDTAFAFARAAQRARRRVCFFGVEARFTPPGFATMLIGEQPVWDPGRWQTISSQSRSLREQLRRARAKGVRIDEVVAAEQARDRALYEAVEHLVDDWLATRPMAPMGFVVDVRPFLESPHRRCFVARGASGEVVALLSAAPIFARAGWLVEHLLRSPRAPNGTAELLIDALMRAADAQGSRYVTLGLAPLGGEVPTPLRWARRRLSVLYNFDGLHAFKAKLRPARWDPIFIAFPARGRLAPALAIRDVLAAFAGGSFVRFGIRTVVHNPRLLLAPLSVLLVPWTLLVLLAGASWFPSRGVQYGWVVFDALVAPALFLLGKRFRLWLAVVIAIVVAGDSVLTFVEAMVYNVPRVRGVAEAALIAAAWAAPTTTAVLLWLEVARRLEKKPHTA